MTQKIDYFFGLGSPWAYLGLDAFTALAKAHGAEIVPHLIPLIEENGGIYSRNRPPRAPRLLVHRPQTLGQSQGCGAGIFWQGGTF